MMKFRSSYGIRYVFGVVVNYKEWRICRLKDSDTAGGGRDGRVWLATSHCGHLAVIKVPQPLTL